MANGRRRNLVRVTIQVTAYALIFGVWTFVFRFLLDMFEQGSSVNDVVDEIVGIGVLVILTGFLFSRIEMDCLPERSGRGSD